MEDFICVQQELGVHKGKQLSQRDSVLNSGNSCFTDGERGFLSHLLRQANP